ncbi:MAG: MerR family transcriptional regulator, partial [Clostridium sp.]
MEYDGSEVIDMYSIKEASDRLNVSIHTLRYYEKEGLTPFVNRDKNGVRVYTDVDIEWIYMIRCLRDTDMPISMIREYIALYMEGEHTLEKRREIMYSYQSFVNNRIKTMETCLKHINKKLEYYDMAVNKNISLNCGDYK